jgi:hypothetical protein
MGNKKSDRINQMKQIILIITFTITLFADYNATQNAQNLGLYYQDYNSMMALTGILIGFSIMLGAIILTIKVGSGK